MDETRERFRRFPSLKAFFFPLAPKMFKNDSELWSGVVVAW